MELEALTKTQILSAFIHQDIISSLCSPCHIAIAFLEKHSLNKMKVTRSLQPGASVSQFTEDGNSSFGLTSIIQTAHRYKMPEK